MTTRALALRWLAALTCAGMFLVLVMGAAVTNTGSAEGCGRSWPLCNGQLVPEFTVSTAIEYSHRAVTGGVGLLVFALTVLMLARWRRDREPLVLAGVMLLTLLLQAALGAGAVLWPQSPLMLATHFGVSLAAFAATFLSAVVVFERTATASQALAAASLTTSRASVSAVGRTSLRNWTIGIGVYVLAVVYLGAYVRHAGLSLACADWPLCDGQLVPSLSGPTGVVVAHRLAALGALALLGWLARLAVRQGLARRAAAMAAGLGLLQALSGALVVWTRLGLFSTLAHAALVALLFACLVYVARRAAGLPKGYEFVAEVFSPSDEEARNLPPTRVVSSPHVMSNTGSGDSAGLPRAVAVDRGQRQRPDDEASQRPAGADQPRSARGDQLRPTGRDQLRPTGRD